MAPRKYPPIIRFGDDNEESDDDDEEEEYNAGKTDDESEEDDEEWDIDNDDDKNNKGNGGLKSKRYRKKRKLKSKESVCTMIEDINNDDTTPQKVSSSNTNNTNHKQVKFIKFEFDDGKYHVVRRSLLESFPNTMLARKASNALKNINGNETCEPIEIERDGNRFEFIIDYMRDGIVSLPCSVSKEALLRDFKYLGFVVDPNMIQVEIRIFDVADHSIYWKTKHEEKIKESKVDESKVEDGMFQNENMIKETKDELIREIKEANEERERKVNLAQSKADANIKKAEEIRLLHLEAKNKIKLERQYSNLAYKCLQHYMNTKELEWRCTDLSEFQSYGSYRSHENISDFLSKKTPINDDMIMKRIANEFGLSYIHAYFEAIIIRSCTGFDDTDDDSDAARYIYRVKYDIISK